MLDSIYLGMSGLQGFSKGLKVIANNTANINTPGYKGSSLQFADMFYSGNSDTTGQVGHGLNTAGTTLNFKQGELRQTGNSLDLAVDGEGLFTLKDSNGALHYTRAGQFEFNTDGVLVNRLDGSKVMGRDANNTLTEISINGVRNNAGKPTGLIKFAGNLSSTSTTPTVISLTVLDRVGGEHALSVKLTNTNSTTPGSWSVELVDGTTTVGTGQIVFINGSPDPAAATVSINYTPAGQAALPLVLDFTTNVTSFASAGLSTLAMSSQDGYVPGALTNVGFDAAGTMVLTYSNGQTAKGSTLAMSRFDSVDAVKAIGSNQFDMTDSKAWHAGISGNGGFGAVKSGVIEISNVDLSQEFSDLVVMQRGYQASSQIISTANEMLQELFAMRGK